MLTADVYQDALCGVIQREYGPLRHAAKILARISGVTPRAAENWLAGICAPGGAALLNLTAQSEAVNIEVERLKAMARGEA